MAEQDQILVTKAYMVTIQKQQDSKKSRMCKERDETVITFSECTCSNYGFEPAKHWYEYRAERVVENQDTNNV